jgi:hypothetical protein
MGSSALKAWESFVFNNILKYAAEYYENKVCFFVCYMKNV